MKTFRRDEEIRNTQWQFVGDVINGEVRLLVAYKDHNDHWQHFPVTVLEAREGQTLEDRFTEFVDRFIQPYQEAT